MEDKIQEDAVELAEDFTDWMGPSWPMCGGINATAKLATMANSRFRKAENAAKIEVLEKALSFSGNEFPFVEIQSLIDILKEIKDGL